MNGLAKLSIPFFTAFILFQMPAIASSGAGASYVVTEIEALSSDQKVIAHFQVATVITVSSKLTHALSMNEITLAPFITLTNQEFGQSPLGSYAATTQLNHWTTAHDSSEQIFRSIFEASAFSIAANQTYRYQVTKRYEAKLAEAKGHYRLDANAGSTLKANFESTTRFERPSCYEPSDQRVKLN